MAEIVVMGQHVMNIQGEGTCPDCGGTVQIEEDVSLVQGEPVNIFLQVRKIQCVPCDKYVIVFEVVEAPIELLDFVNANRKDTLQ